MRKRLSVVLLLLAILLPVFSFGQTASADDRYYEIRNFIVDVVLNTDGSADIEERITYDFYGSFNGVLRNIDYIQSDGLDNLQVFTASASGIEKELTVNSSTDLDAEGPSGTFNIYHDDEIAHLKVYEKSSNEAKVFIYKYTLLNVATKYNDIAEFNRRVIDANWDTDLNDITVHIRLPEGASKDEIMVFGHGPLTGESMIIDGQNVEFILDRLSPGYYLETLVLFPPGLIPDSSRVIAEDARQRILDNEKVLADEANAQREEARRQVEEYNRRREEREAMMDTIRTICNVIGVLLIIAWFVIIISIYIKYDKELKSSFSAKYYRELPGEYTPAEMSVLVNMGNILTRDITATLMDLVRKGHLILKQESYIKDGFFRDKEVEDYSLTLNPEAPSSGLTRHEAFLIKWFINTIGDGSKVFLDNITDYAGTTSGAMSFSKNYEKWRKLVNEEAEKNNFFDKSSKKGQVAGALIGLAYFVTGIIFIFSVQALPSIILIILGIIMMIFAARLNKRTAYGNEQYSMWMAFKNFLREFSRLDRAEMPSIIIWEHYLVYAISLGVAKEVIKQLPLVFSDTDLQNTRLTYMYGHNMHSLYNFTNTFDKTVNTIDHAISNAISIANSKNSSSSGTGGGFSGGGFGGGSGGGGGRGGGGAF